MNKRGGIGGSRILLRRVLAWAAAGIMLALAGCGDLSLIDSLQGDSPGVFQLSPDSLNLPTDSEYAFTAVGGIAPYYFISAGVGAVDQHTWKYKAPSTVTGAEGWDLVTITATDLAGSTDTATVRVFVPFGLSGGSSVILTQGGSAYRFTASGGVAPYTWLLDGTASASGGTYDFDPATAGTFVVAVQDSIGNYRESSVTVVASSGSPLAIDPTGATVEKSTPVTFTAYGGDGSGTYTWQTTAGTIASTGANTAQLTALDIAQEVIVTLSSGTWDPVTARVVVTASAPTPPPPLVLLPDAPTVDAVGDIVQFSASGGTPPYTYVLKNQYKNWATITTDGLYTHGKSGKNVVVTVEDSGAPVQSVSTTVYWQN
jgi:hypothetical protein